MDCDVEGPVCNISAWHQRHVQYISNIKNLADMGSAAAKDVPSGVILLAVTFFVFFTGSDGMLRWLQEKAATIKWDLLASGSTKNFATISGDALQIPMQQKIHVNTWYLASRSDAMLLDEELESEDKIANVENIRLFRGAAAAAAQALRHACLCRLAKQKLQELPGMKGSGYALKNLALLLRDICKECPYLGDKVSSGGPGLRQCYNLQSGCERKRLMTEQALHGYLALALSGHYWSQRKFGEYVWKKLEPHEEKMIASSIGGFRCALDKAIWRHYLEVGAPTGDTWRKFCSEKRKLEDEEQENA